MKYSNILIKYLKSIYELEKECYVWEGLIKAEGFKSWPEVPMPNRPVLIPYTECPKKRSWSSHVIFSICSALFTTGIVSLILFVILFLFVGWVYDQKGMRMNEIASMFFDLSVKIGCLLFLLGSFFLIISKPKKDRIIKEKYDQEQKKIKKKNAEVMALYNQALEIRNAKVKQNELSQHISSENMALLKAKYNDSKLLLKKYYDLNILYTNYRGLARVSKYLEFLESGICSSLEGGDGAYKLCEQMILKEIEIENQGIMIQKLSELVQGINDMNKTNLMMYRALCDVNQNITRIQGGFEQQNQLLKGMQSNLVSLKQNTQATAYFSEITAKNNQLLVDYAEYNDFALRQKRLEEGKYN